MALDKEWGRHARKIRRSEKNDWNDIIHGYQQRERHARRRRNVESNEGDNRRYVAEIQSNIQERLHLQFTQGKVSLDIINQLGDMVARQTRPGEGARTTGNKRPRTGQDEIPGPHRQKRDSKGAQRNQSPAKGGRHSYGPPIT